MKSELNIKSCECGAITITINNVDYSMTFPTFVERFGNTEDIPYFGMYSNCNHCANNWGIDICACGSGKKFDECDEGFDACGNPMQIIK